MADDSILHTPAETRKSITDKMTFVNKKDDEATGSEGHPPYFPDRMLQGPDGYFDQSRNELLNKLNKLPNRGLKKGK